MATLGTGGEVKNRAQCEQKIVGDQAGKSTSPPVPRVAMSHQIVSKLRHEAISFTAGEEKKTRKI